MKSYLELLRSIERVGEVHDDRTGTGTTSVFGRQWRCDLREGFPLLTTKKVFFRGVMEELAWFISGDSCRKTLEEKSVYIWSDWGTSTGELGYVYGRAQRCFEPSRDGQPGNDQLESLFDELNDNPGSRRLIVSHWHPIHSRYGMLGGAPPACHTLWQLKVHQNVLPWEVSLSLYARSIDAFLGLPFNIASYALLLKLIAHSMHWIARDLIISFGDLHIYNNHREQVKQQLSRETRPLPQLHLDHTLAGKGLQTLTEFRSEHAHIADYDPHPAIAAPISV